MLLKGMHLSLMIGPVVATPVPYEVINALIQVEVTTNTEGPSAFQLSFNLSNRSRLHTLFLLSAGTPIPMVRVIVVAIIQGTAEVLIDGVVTHHEVAPGTDASHSMLKITGEDLTRVMDYIDFSGIPYPAMPREARVAAILAKYMTIGVVPMIIPSVLIDVPLPVDKIPSHRGKDLAYLRQLAAEVGHIFYVEPGPSAGTTVAYWGPELRMSTPQPALSLDMDAHTNVESLTFRYQPEKRVMPYVVIQHELTKVPVPIPIPSDLSPLSPPLGAVSGFPQHIEPLLGCAKMTVPQAIMVGMAAAVRSAEIVTGTGTLDVLRYGRTLKARKLVGVRGAGEAFDGLHYVKSVSHHIRRGEYKQSFTLVRNGLLSTVSQVPA
jgi:hypothetical protein